MVQLCSDWKCILDLVRNIDDILLTSGLENTTVSYVGGMKVLLTFLSPADAKNFLYNMRDTWLEWFSNLCLWTGQSFGFERIAWLSIKGVPLSLWDRHGFNKNVERFGRVVQGSDVSFSDRNLSSGRVAVLVYDAFKIAKEVDLHSDSQHFRIWVVEDDTSRDRLVSDGFFSNDIFQLGYRIGRMTSDASTGYEQSQNIDSNPKAQGPHDNSKGVNNSEPNKAVKSKRKDLGSAERPFIPDLNIDADDPFGIWDLIWKEDEIARNNKRRKVAPRSCDKDREVARKRRRVGVIDLNTPV
ncbi:hypothetical protein L1987_64043 [Smallanthus sonchifolius]|uniref:Uncharacterized protein n=1 Tax=Smallanthus sonchifolius TaxID=185202 RepID=A0ACB9CEW9_9ASTR|nr:hypothetical protein L1987_64043 [Smallanthus sonchifolius]